MKYQYFMLPEEATRMLWQFAQARNAKALMLDERRDYRQIKIYRDEEIFKSIPASLPALWFPFYMVEQNLTEDETLFDLSPRQEAWLMVRLGRKVGKMAPPVLTLSDFAADYRNIGGAFHRWFAKYRKDTRNGFFRGVMAEYDPDRKQSIMDYGIVKDASELDGKSFCDHLWYTQGALDLCKAGWVWKQHEDFNMLYSPPDAP